MRGGERDAAVAPQQMAMAMMLQLLRCRWFFVLAPAPAAARAARAARSLAAAAADAAGAAGA